MSRETDEHYDRLNREIDKELGVTSRRRRKLPAARQLANAILLWREHCAQLVCQLAVGEITPETARRRAIVLVRKRPIKIGDVS